MADTEDGDRPRLPPELDREKARGPRAGLGCRIKKARQVDGEPTRLRGAIFRGDGCECARAGC